MLIAQRPDGRGHRRVGLRNGGGPARPRPQALPKRPPVYRPPVDEIGLQNCGYFFQVLLHRRGGRPALGPASGSEEA